MTQLTYSPMPTDTVAHLRAGGTDAYDQPAEKTISNGAGNPCRHCLSFVPKGAGMLIIAHRPFGKMQPYAETGPIFLCAGDCAPFAGNAIPLILTTSAAYLLKGYTADERICYGTGKIVPPDALPEYAAELLSRPEIAFVDVRSASNNCFLTRITANN